MQTSATSAFVEDWLVSNTVLGEGAYGEVKLLIHRKTDEKIACKIIDHQKHKNAAENIQREVVIHKMLNHENIIKYFGRRHENLREYIFLEYAAGGELFQLIEPDYGMPSQSVQTYMKQILEGLHYLHTQGVTHRDIKPENLLISQDGVLKISDFGMATLFRWKGKERLMDKKCGTKPYLAPEILKGPYRAQPADLWSCGIVFVAMLTGELPWSEPTDRNEDFGKWLKDEYLSDTPWSKLGNTALCLARQILNVDPKKRLTLQQIQNHIWMKFNFDKDTCTESLEGDDDSEDTAERPAKRWNSMVENETKLHSTRDIPQVALSQPNLTVRRPDEHAPAIVQTLKRDQVTFSFSQPTHNEDLMLQMTQSPITKENFHHLVKRMTRFYVKTNLTRTLDLLGSMLDSLHYTWNLDPNGAVSISTVDMYKNQLTFKANLLDMDGRILADFRLSKGCGLEFKKKFLKLKDCLSDIIDKDQ